MSDINAEELNGLYRDTNTGKLHVEQSQMSMGHHRQVEKFGVTYGRNVEIAFRARRIPASTIRVTVLRVAKFLGFGTVDKGRVPEAGSELPVPEVRPSSGARESGGAMTRQHDNDSRTDPFARNGEANEDATWEELKNVSPEQLREELKTITPDDIEEYRRKIARAWGDDPDDLPPLFKSRGNSAPK